MYLFHTIPRALTRNGIIAWHAGIAQRTPVDANRALAVLSAFLSWCEHDNKIERNFAKGVKRRQESARHVYLNADGITAPMRRSTETATVPPHWRCAYAC